MNYIFNFNNFLTFHPATEIFGLKQFYGLEFILNKLFLKLSVFHS